MAEGPMAKIRFERVTKRYANSPAPAVDDISLSVAEGRLVVLLGPSGCGKTTLLKMTNRLIEPTSGAIYMDGVDIRRFEVTGLRRKIGYVIQQVGLFPHMTVAENISVVPELLKWDKSRIRARVEELLALVHLDPGEFLGRYPAQLSGGQQQRVGLARALAGDPDVLLMDEPFGAIDAITRSSLQEEIMQLQNRLRKTILFVTHDVDEALLLADEMAVLRAGKLVQFGEPCWLLSHPADAFVSELLGAGDRIRQLSLIDVETYMTPLSQMNGKKNLPEEGSLAGKPVLSPHDNLRHALGIFLNPGIESLPVMQDGRPVGELTLEQLRRAVGCGEQPAEGAGG